MPSQAKTAHPGSHARSASSPPDESLFQLVQSRALYQSSPQHQMPAASVPTPQLEGHPVSFHRVNVSQAQQGSQPLMHQQSGNPFASETPDSNSGAGVMRSASLGLQLPSGNPFAEEEGSRSQTMNGNRAAGASASALGQHAANVPPDGGSPKSSVGVSKHPEMSPLQNGLIRQA